MSTKEQIIQVADSLIRDKGYNAFSFFDISNAVGIKKASIHYHFPQKIDLGIAVIDYHIENFHKMKKDFEDKSPLQKLDKFLSIYRNIKNDNKICIVGSLSTDYNTLDIGIIEHLKIFSEQVLNWVIAWLKYGQEQGTFHFKGEPRTKAVLLISTMIASVQITRLTGDEDFTLIQKIIKEDLIKND